MKASQHAIYRNEIARLHHQSDNKDATIQILRDAMTAQRANHNTDVARVRREMAPGFSWPDPDGAHLLTAKIESQEATMTKMATKMAKMSTKLDKLNKMSAENTWLKTENTRLNAKMAAKEDDKLDKAVAELTEAAYVRDGMRETCAQANGGDMAGIVAKLAGIVDEIGAIKRLCTPPEADKMDRIAGELALITAELHTLRFLRSNPGESGTALLIAELDKVTAERDALRNLYAHHNTAGKNLYTERRSKVNKDIKEIEEGIAEELGTTLDIERAKAAAGNGACRAEGQCKDHAGSSHHNKPDEKIWYTRTQCPRCQATGCLVYKYTSGTLVNDFFEDRMWIKTTCHLGAVYDCAACGREILPRLPNIKGTAFGKKALSFIVQLGGRKNVDADIAEIFGDMFDFKTAETTIWNARCAAADLLEPTMMIIRNALRNAKHLGIDETYYASEGDSGYVWVVRTDRVTFVLAMSSRGEDVIEKYMSDLLHIPVTTDGYAPYLKHFKILQRCWAHILRDAESAYVNLDKDDPMRAYYVDLYQKLLDIFHDAKSTAVKTAAGGGADRVVCAEFEERVMCVVATHGSHGFATTLAGAAPNLFTFLRYPGMPPTNNDTERDIRDAVVVQRKIRRRFVNARGRHVFSVIQSFNSTCRKLGLVPWRCMERIIDDPKYDILEAGDDVKRLATPWSETKPLTHQLCIDGKAAETHGVTLNAKKAGKLTAKITAEAAVQGGVETKSAVETTTPEAAVQGGVETKSAVETTTPEAAVQGGVETESAVETTTPEAAVQGGVETESAVETTMPETTVQGGVETESAVETTMPETTVQGGVETESAVETTMPETTVQGGVETESAVETTTPETAVQGGVETKSAVETTTPEAAVQGGVETKSAVETTTPEAAVQGGVETESAVETTMPETTVQGGVETESAVETTMPETTVQGGVETESAVETTMPETTVQGGVETESAVETTTPETTVQGGVETESAVETTMPETTVQGGVETESAVETTMPETTVQGGVETESAVETTMPETTVQGGVETESAVETTTPETAVPEANVEVNVASASQTHLTNNDRPPPMQPCALGVAGHEQATDPDTPNARPYRGKPPPAVAA